MRGAHDAWTIDDGPGPVILSPRDELLRIQCDSIPDVWQWARIAC